MATPTSPFFSVVIPAYNRAAYLPRAIESVLAQTDGDFEVLVIDDGSTDNTAEVVQAIPDPRVRYVYQTNAERGAARNHGVREARGLYICFLDSDDRWLPNHLAAAKTAIQDAKQPACHHFGYRHEAPDGTVERLQQPKDLTVRALVSGNHLSCNGVVIPKSVLEELPFSEERALSGSEDYALWLRIASRKGWHAHPQPITSVLVNDPAVRGSLDNASLEKLLKRLELLVSSTQADPVLRAAIQPYFLRFQANLGHYAALHLAMGGHKRQARRHWLEAVTKAPSTLFERRSLGVLKRLVR